MATDELHHRLPSAVSGPKQAQPSPLTALPPELRNRIYALVFEDHVSDAWKGAYNDSMASVPGLIMACKQLHQEALGIFYSHAIFQFSSVFGLESWLKRVGSPRTILVHRVRILYSASHEKQWVGKPEKETIAAWRRQDKVSSGLEVWYRISLYWDLCARIMIELWTRNPDDDEKGWNNWQKLRSKDPGGRNINAPIAANSLTADCNFPMWLIEAERWRIKAGARKHEDYMVRFLSKSLRYENKAPACGFVGGGEEDSLRRDSD